MRIPLLAFFFLFQASLNAQTDSLQSDSTATKNKIHSNWNEAPLKNRFSIGFDFSYGYSYRKIESKMYPELINCRNQCEHAVYLPKEEIVFHYKMNKWIQFTTGLNYLQTGFDNKESVKLNDTLSTEFTIACDAYNAVDPARGFVYYGFFDPRFLFVFHSLHPSQCDRLTQVRYDYIDIPLNIRFSYQKRDYSFYFYGGLSENYLLKESVRDIFTSNGTVISDQQYTTFFSTDIHNRTKINFSWLAGAGIRYSLNKKISVELHGGIQKQFINLFDYEFGVNYQEYHYRYEVGVGVYYILNRDKKN